MQQRPFRILSIDGGGIRGIFPAMFLANLEAELKAKGQEKTQVWQHFDLIAGTSTGGILAIALALDMPAHEIARLYIDNAASIFGKKRGFFTRFTYAAHNREFLEHLLRSKFKSLHNGDDPLLRDCKTNVCVPIYDLMQGKPSVLKNNYHPAFVRDYHIPAYQAALATSAAPTYFDPYSAKYTDLKGIEQTFSNKVDGGVFANNPSLLAIIEAQKAFGQKLENIQVLSIGTGHQKFADACSRTRWGIGYWMLQGDRKRLIELFMQGQSQQVQNLISLLHRGIDRQEGENFIYKRIDTELDESCSIELDEIKRSKLEKLSEKAGIEFQNSGNEIIKMLHVNLDNKVAP
ncbi:MAG: patatin [Chitinophagaceae bacterium]|nr:MAG: patatin [Chitinophagaceae bacterium]